MLHRNKDERYQEINRALLLSEVSNERKCEQERKKLTRQDKVIRGIKIKEGKKVEQINKRKRAIKTVRKNGKKNS